MLSTSPFGKLNAADAWKTFRGALLIAAGYVLTSGLEALLADLSNGTIDLGEYVAVKGLLITGLTSLLEVIRRVLTDYSRS